MSFTVAGKDTRIFRTKITNVRAEFDHFRGEGIYFELNFDNFRTYTAGAGEVDARCPKWSNEFIFNYETEFADLLVAKIMKISFLRGDHEFIGEASCDLLTLATGCQDCRFKIFASSDDVCGKVFMNVEMEEVAETCVIIKEIKLSFNHGVKETPSDMADARIYIETKAPEPGIRRSHRPQHFDAFNVMWKDGLEPNYFGSTVTSILQEAGLRIRLVESGWCSETEFGSGMISIGSLPNDQLQTNPHNVPFGPAEFFDISGQHAIGSLTGTLAITRMPIYTQMYAGLNIDGVIHDGQSIPGAKYMPPRCKGSNTANVKI